MVSLKVRRWTTDLQLARSEEEQIHTKNDLELVLRKAVEAELVKNAQGITSAVTQLGIFRPKGSRHGTPMVNMSNEWYLLIPTAQSDSFYEGQIFDQRTTEHGGLAAIASSAYNGLIDFAKWVGGRRVAPAENFQVEYDKNGNRVGLEKALKFPKQKIPVYSGETHDFASKILFWKKSRPLTAKIGKDEISIRGTIPVTPEGFDAALTFFSQEHNYKTVAYSDSILPKPVGLKEDISSHNVKTKAPGPAAVKNSPNARREINRQLTHDISYHDTIDYNRIQYELSEGNFELKYVSGTVFAAERVPAQGLESLLKVHLKSNETGKEIPGFFMVSPDSGKQDVEGFTELITAADGSVVQRRPPRLISNDHWDVKYWPSEIEAGELIEEDQWYAGHGSTNIVEGYVLVPKMKIKNDGEFLNGIVGIPKSKWQELLVSKLAADIVYKKSTAKINTGLSDSEIEKYVLKEYESHPIYELGTGAKNFAKRVITKVRNQFGVAELLKSG